MKTVYVIDAKQIPVTPPLIATAVLYLLLDHWHVNAIAQAVIWTIWSLFFIGACIRWFLQEKIAIKEIELRQKISDVAHKELRKSFEKHIDELKGADKTDFR